MENDDLAVQLLDVLRFETKRPRFQSVKRDFYALSFRMETGRSWFLYGGKRVSAEGAQICFIPAGVNYGRETDGEKCIVFHFSCFNAIGEEVQALRVGNPEAYRAQFEAALALWDARQAGYRYRASAILYEILAQLQQEGISLQGGAGLVYNAKRCIDRRFADCGFSVKRLAEEMFVSESYLRRQFSAAFGVSPKQYLSRVRMEYAISLLQTGYYSQSEIAARCGYRDVAYFRTAFRRFTGQCLSEYRYRAEADSDESKGKTR